MDKINVRIKENSWRARVAARQLRAHKVAMVFGKTIYLHKTSKDEFLRNTKWVRHEVAHINQYRKLGLVRFLCFYLIESFNKGYKNNRFEVEARQKEKDPTILSGVHFV